jgi:hypothetical protein
MDELSNSFNQLNILNNIRKIKDDKIVATNFIKSGTNIGYIYGDVKYFWEIILDKSLTSNVNSEIPIDLTNRDSTIFCETYTNTGNISDFWKVYPKVNKFFTINGDLVLDVSNNISIIKYINEDIEIGNCKLDYDIDYVNGIVCNFRIITTKDIDINNEIILKYDVNYQ